MSDLLHSFDAFFAGEKPYNGGGAFGQQVGNESYRVIYTGSQREVLREHIESIEAQLRNAKVGGMIDAMDICSEVASNSNEFRVRDGANLCKMEIKEAIRALKDKP